MSTAKPSQDNNPTPAAKQALHGYLVQDLPERYLKIRVLEAYIRAKPAEFGETPHFQTIRDLHRITVKRELRQDEILELQRASFPGYFADQDWVT